jgi:hypothetical protein
VSLVGKATAFSFPVKLPHRLELRRQLRRGALDRL